ncbi:MAG: hypothetical protein J7603_16500 [Pseudacidovorax sp.]|nr:hypothetical protein [Pseudacidovorax sp.]
MNIPPELQDWLKTSIGGIVLLGAIGSLLAVLVGRLLIEIKRRVLPVPYYAHMKRKQRLSYFLGFTHATIEADKTGRALATFLAFRASRLLFALVLFLFSAVLASNVLVFQAQVALTVGLFLSIVAAFLALYWAYFEFEYIYRTYLWIWKRTMSAADTGYKKYTDSTSDGTDSPRKGSDSTAS